MNMQPQTKIVQPVRKTIVLPEEGPPPTLEEQLRGAIYAAAMYYHVTKVQCGHRTVYIIPEWFFEEEGQAVHEADLRVAD